MKKIVLNKKIILIVLTVILLVILVSNYIKTADHSLLELFNKDKSSAEELLFNEKENEIQSQEIENRAENEEIESIALISEIKDPFAAAAQAEMSTDQIDLNAKNQQGKELIFLENNIIAEELKLKNKSAAELFQKENEIDSEKIDSAEKKPEEFLEKIKLPFELLGIIKNQNSASALFLYQGENILKQEKDNIDIFKIESIKKQEIIISYQNERLKINLWKEEENEK